MTNDLRSGIVSAIKRLAGVAEGRPPGEKLFAKETGIAQHKWRGVYWARWGDALKEAGFEPNEWASKFDSGAILEKVASLALKNGALPTRSELDLAHRADSTMPMGKLVATHFGGRSGIVGALQDLASTNSEFSGLTGILPLADDIKKAPSTRVMDGWVYLLRSGDFFKIGRSDNLERRVKQISVSLPEIAGLHHAIQTDDPVGIETYWHNRFSARRANGEWFKLTKHDVAAFKRRKFQ